ncbi:uncharacterized protein EDB93DRAFT_1176032 [Suillus bovinus]|uniref:uncharacterized protein n=1 Tax=Suillus bovinus TaxID=48563 RepID=UPI001B85E720|nr:uncharacterized protein EDB93DRAFT_1176032 [Suillus bovinus]KAG2132704.1 hypothetical protein EDB93DRAFT_1176032 [Suillus bovinus]
MRFSFLALVCALTASMAVSTQADTNAECGKQGKSCNPSKKDCCEGYTCATDATYSYCNAHVEPPPPGGGGRD